MVFPVIRGTVVADSWLLMHNHLTISDYYYYYYTALTYEVWEVNPVQGNGSLPSGLLL